MNNEFFGWQKLIWLIIGLLIGVGTMVAYGNSSGQPQTATQSPETCSVATEQSNLKAGDVEVSRKKIKQELGEVSEEDIDSAEAYLKFKKIKEAVLPSGSPVYASELEVSYNQADQAVDKLANLEQNVGKENLSREQKERYKEIGTTGGTSCEHCCGLTSKDGFARSNGQRQCGCAHNAAFSGLTMWMIENGYSNQEILKEINKWKSSFFPKQTLTQSLQEMKKNNPEAEKILKEFPAFLPNMVGGC